MHIQKCVKYAFAKNQGNKQGLEENLRGLIPHQFGDHQHCKPRFCGFLRKPGGVYQHRSLPYKTALKDTDLQHQLEEVFEPLIANAEQYIDLGSSQQCEHANREVTLRAPKSLHYGNSESIDFKVHATAAFINEGHGYISMVCFYTNVWKQFQDSANEKGGISPGKFTEEHARKRMKRRREVQNKIQLPSTKLRRLILKQERAVTQGAQETLEGDSYQSGIGHSEHPDITKLPDPVMPGSFKPVTLSSTEEPTMVMFDLETTDLIRGRHMPHIVQIAAVELKSGSAFNTYVRPKMAQTDTARTVTGIVASSSGVFVAGKLVESENIHSAAEKFIKYLKKFKNVCLFAHNGRRFDFPVLISTFKNIEKDIELASVVTCCIDSLSMFKKCFKDQDSYKQESLFRSLLNDTYSAHNAVDDVKALGKLVQHALLSSVDVLTFSFPLNAVLQQLTYNGEKAKNYSSLTGLVQNAVISKSMAGKIAGSGLAFQHLKAIKNRDGEDGLRNTFLDKTRGQARVNCTRKTLDDVVSKLINAL
ncbi:uncharacterized protein LOC133180113 [Saccostrea echinata]|uniref:uncharacterized protein LOC133180113 n=1 Tax=Saccostrea echinata TaxID=191078 RepID=UPI002A82D345|nr:uncharacterized protein LOC133180113 [Saccostrea echinata]